LYSKALASQLVGQQRGKICRNEKRADAPFAEEQIENIDHRRARLSHLAQLFLVQRKGQNSIRLGLLFGPVNLQVAHYHMAGFLVLKKDKRIWNKKAGCIEHVGVALAGGNQENRLIASELAKARLRGREVFDFGPVVFGFEHGVLSGARNIALPFVVELLR
jgi:hypothetical protein